jgi:LCP family protein required for cell wall assembly
MTKNRLLFWIGVANLSLLLGAAVALLTPIWGDRSALDRLSANNSGQQRSDFLRNGLPYQISRPVNILVMGIKPHPGVVWNTSPAAFTGSSDTMLLLRLNPDRKSIRVLSIPKDSQVVLPEVGLGKISLANSLGGPALAARTVSRTLNNVPIDGYVRITTNALQQLVDQLGGVEIFVPQRMSYQDTTQQLQIDLDPGWQTLNGEQAEQFVRFRSSNAGELDRVQRQQLLIKALRDRLTSPAALPRLPQIARIMRSYIDTNLSPEESLAIVNFTAAINPENLQMLLLPGDLSPFSKDPSSYWIYTPGQDQIMSKYFGAEIIGAAQKPKPLTSVKIAIQNASGKPNLSQQVAQYLKQRGFDKVYIVSDWLDSQRQTEIIAQKGNREAAANLQKVLGLGNIEVAAIGDLGSSLTIRVGKDWNSDRQMFQSSRDDNPYGWQWGGGITRQDR